MIISFKYSNQTKILIDYKILIEDLGINWTVPKGPVEKWERKL
ncbi:MAG: hypothetical protein ACTSRZ_18555 [Promethearchaeota archaeon]